ncbi:hypothetical protein K8I28_12360, partial [bacterium]|nr:hypothetical protein [bacterium]
DVLVRYDLLIKFNSLNYNLVSLSDNNSMLDVFRVFLQYSEQINNRRFEKVYLSHKGKKKFYIDGDYFEKLGSEYSFQNPVYTSNTFCDHLFQLNGDKAYPTWTGGWLGVASRQIKDFTDFHEKWYLYDLAK